MAEHPKTRQEQVQAASAALTYDPVRFLKGPLTQAAQYGLRFIAFGWRRAGVRPFGKYILQLVAGEASGLGVPQKPSKFITPARQLRQKNISAT
jgi:hypothetical protein